MVKQKKLKDLQGIFESFANLVKLKQLHRVRWLSMGCVSTWG